jgi:hypothetical protein
VKVILLAEVCSLKGLLLLEEFLLTKAAEVSLTVVGGFVRKRKGFVHGSFRVLPVKVLCS